MSKKIRNAVDGSTMDKTTSKIKGSKPATKGIMSLAKANEYLSKFNFELATNVRYPWHTAIDFTLHDGVMHIGSFKDAGRFTWNGSAIELSTGYSVPIGSSTSKDANGKYISVTRKDAESRPDVFRVTYDGVTLVEQILKTLLTQPVLAEKYNLYIPSVNEKLTDKNAVLLSTKNIQNALENMGSNIKIVIKSEKFKTRKGNYPKIHLYGNTTESGNTGTGSAEEQYLAPML